MIDPTPPRTDGPVLERIMQGLKFHFETVPMPVAAGETLDWDVIVRAPLTDAERKMDTCVSIMEGQERSSELTGQTEKRLEVSIEYEVKSYLGEEPQAYANEVKAALEKYIAAHFRSHRRCLHMRLTASETDVGRTGDRVVGGILFYEMTYRHRTGDPTKAVGEN